MTELSNNGEKDVTAINLVHYTKRTIKDKFHCDNSNVKMVQPDPEKCMK